MIIGSGNIAKVLPDRDDVIFFASGVSDSSCKNKNEFNRESDLLLSLNKNSHVVYFSNLGIYYKTDDYTKHKINMENLVRDNFITYTIIRFEVCEWVKNPTTILNVFKQKLKDNEKINIIDTTRYVIDLNEFLYWINLIPVGKKNEMNILGRKMKITEIIEEIKNNKL